MKTADTLYLITLVRDFRRIFFNHLFYLKIHSVFILWELRHAGMTSPQSEQSPEVSSTDQWFLLRHFEMLHKICTEYFIIFIDMQVFIAPN